MSNTGHISGLNRKLKENRDKTGSSSRRLKSKNKVRNYQNSFTPRRGHRRNLLASSILTLVIFSLLIFLGAKVLGAFHEYESHRPQVDREKIRIENYDLCISYGEYDLREHYYDEAKTEFENALKIFPNDPKALQGLEQANNGLTEQLQ
ncbi:MAG: hypothetical protein ACI857_002810 [Arenicella sp.]|jgi:hypothetical protein